MAFDVAQAALLFNLPLLRHAVEKCCVDATVELVDIHRIDPRLQPIVLLLQPGNGRVLLSPFVSVTCEQRIANPVHDFVVEHKTIQQSGKLLFQHFPADIGFAAFPLVAGAVIVDVTLLLDLAHDRTAAVAAQNQT